MENHQKIKKRNKDKKVFQKERIVMEKRQEKEISKQNKEHHHRVAIIQKIYSLKFNGLRII